MINRRQILQSGLAAASLPALGSVAWTPRERPTLAALDIASPCKVIVDRRFAPSRQFGLAAQWRGHEVAEIAGDITDVWYHQLRPRWRKGPAAIAGLTGYGALFCLERLAWDAGLRVTHQEREEADTAEPLYFWLITPRAGSPSILQTASA